MITLPALLIATNRPNFADIDLPVLQQLYYQEIYPYFFEFSLASGETIQLKFSLENFCHLLGIQSTAKQQRNIHLAEYKGLPGWNNISAGALNKASLRGLGVNLQPMKDKVLHFYYLPRLLRTGKLAVKYVKTNDNLLNPELIIYDEHLPDRAFISIGLIKETDFGGKFYIPITFLVNRITTSNPTYKFGAPPSTTHNIIARSIYPRFKSQGIKVTSKKRSKRRSKIHGI